MNVRHSYGPQPQFYALLFQQTLTLPPVDPWFNFRATKYLVQNGFYSFWDWFDDRKTPEWGRMMRTAHTIPI